MAGLLVAGLPGAGLPGAGRLTRRAGDPAARTGARRAAGWVSAATGWRAWDSPE
ncbi:hypothetical protein ACFU3E_24330 [Streptomyces sp. NPDC057424]|uniref:hypothetical protein n=1 Tax=Streptomyces sp. NPDC057424 TaxID=3346127 RepID=UPI00369320E1